MVQQHHCLVCRTFRLQVLGCTYNCRPFARHCKERSSLARKEQAAICLSPQSPDALPSHHLSPQLQSTGHPSAQQLEELQSAPSLPASKLAIAKPFISLPRPPLPWLLPTIMSTAQPPPTQPPPTHPPPPLLSQVEELQRTKPATKPLLATPVSSFLDFNLPSITLGSSSSGAVPPGGSGGSSSNGPTSKFDAFTKKFKETMVDLINTDLSAPYDAGQGSGGRVQTPPQLTPQRAGTPQQLMPQRGGTPTGAASGGSAASASVASPVMTSRDSPVQQQQAQQQQLRVAVVAGGAGGAQIGALERGAGSSGGGAGAGANGGGSVHGGSAGAGAAGVGRWGLRERVVAIESLTAIADELKAAKGGRGTLHHLLNILSNSSDFLLTPLVVLLLPHASCGCCLCLHTLRIHLPALPLCTCRTMYLQSNTTHAIPYHPYTPPQPLTPTHAPTTPGALLSVLSKASSPPGGAAAAGAAGQGSTSCI